MKELKDKLVLITGGSSGIGYEQVKMFLNVGAKVINLDIKNIDTSHPNLKHYNCDVTDFNKLDMILGNLSLNKIDIFVNTAGILDAWKNIEETDFQYYKKIMSVNVDAAFYIAKKLLEIKKKDLNIVIMTSIAGEIANGGGISYTMSKHALNGFIKQLAHDYAANNVRVNGIAPGAIKTDMNKADFMNGGEIAEQVRQEIPMKRWALPIEVAKATLFLASDDASYITGSILTVDGGWLVR